MLQFIHIHHQFGAQVLFQDFSWHIKPGTKTALIGPNGVGKTTLFRIATGKIIPDRGMVVLSKGTQVSLFQQIPEFSPQETVIETLLKENTLYNQYRTQSEFLHSELNRTSPHSKEYSALLNEWEELENFAEKHDLHNLESQARIVLSGLGFSQNDMNQPVGSFSPGFQHRLALAITLLNPHNLLLLDEPTNHLDDASKEWLADYLKQTKSAFVLVTHDPDFLNKTTHSITELNPRGVFEFQGSLDEFFEAKEEIQQKLHQQFMKEQAYLKERMEWVERFRAKATKAKQVQSVLKKLEKREKLENPSENFWEKELKYQFRYEPGSKMSFRVESASFRYLDEEEFVFHGVDMEVSLGDKVALVGPNGAGKSTFLRCIAGLQNFTIGEFVKGPKTKIGYFSQTHEEELDPHLSLLATVMRKNPSLSEVEARTLLGYFAFSGETVFKPIQSLSGGERSRLRLALLVHTPSNLLLLDEPTNHLDLVVRDGLKKALLNYPGSVLIISHDPDFLDGLCNKTYLLQDGKLQNLNQDFHSYLQETQKEPKKRFPQRETTPTNKPQLEQNGNLGKSRKNQIRNRMKTLEKEIPLIEKKLELLEKNKRDKEELLADPQFAKKRSYQSELDAYKEIKNEIAKLTEEWENAMNEWEELKKQKQEQL